MGWLSRMFGKESAESQWADAVGQARARADAAREQSRGDNPDVPIERQGLNGEYDQSGMAKRVAAALDDCPDIDDVDTLWVAQTGNTIVLKGSAPDQGTLDLVVEIAQGVDGVSGVDTSKVKVEG